MNSPLWKKFNALGTEIILTAFLDSGQEYILNQAEQVVLDFGKRFSRFLKNSELSVFNNFSGQEFQASEMFIDLLIHCQKMNQETNGVFNPTIITSLEAVGYDKSFSEIAAAQGGEPLASLDTSRSGRQRREKYEAKTETKINPEKISQDFLNRPKFSDLKIVGNKIIKPAGLRIEFGGIGKGYIADFLAKNIFRDVKNFWVSAGGDLFLKGSDANTNGWKIGIQNPVEPEKEVFAIQTRGKDLGIATSAIFKRKGVSGDFKWHHLINPATGLPVENNIIAVTAVAPSAQQADIYAKTTLILGKHEGLKFIESRNDSVAIIFFKDRSLEFSEGAIAYF